MDAKSRLSRIDKRYKSWLIRNYYVNAYVNNLVTGFIFQLVLFTRRVIRTGTKMRTRYRFHFARPIIVSSIFPPVFIIFPCVVFPRRSAFCLFHSIFGPREIFFEITTIISFSWKSCLKASVVHAISRGESELSRVVYPNLLKKSRVPVLNRNLHTL